MEVGLYLPVYSRSFRGGNTIFSPWLFIYSRILTIKTCFSEDCCKITPLECFWGMIKMSKRRRGREEERERKEGMKTKPMKRKGDKKGARREQAREERKGGRERRDMKMHGRGNERGRERGREQERQGEEVREKE